jgi:hypothetical protein
MWHKVEMRLSSLLCPLQSANSDSNFGFASHNGMSLTQQKYHRYAPIHCQQFWQMQINVLPTVPQVVATVALHVCVTNMHYCSYWQYMRCNNRTHISEVVAPKIGMTFMVQVHDTIKSIKNAMWHKVEMRLTSLSYLLYCHEICAHDLGLSWMTL